MTTLDDIFTAPTDYLPHPVLRHWKLRLAQPGVTAVLEVVRPPVAIGVAPPEMNLQFCENGTVQVDEVAWDDDLNLGLIQMGVRSLTPELEAIRFALGLRASFRKAEREFGDGYLNSMILDYVNQSELAQTPEVAQVLKDCSALPPRREGKSAERYKRCREMISDGMTARAHELTEKLGYNEPEAKAIFIQAVARYLEERFGILARRRLGLL